MRTFDISEKARELEERKRSLGIDDARFEAARNNGSARTPAKRQLLRTIDDTARRQGRKPAYAANY